MEHRGRCPADAAAQRRRTLPGGVMNDRRKTKAQLLAELEALRQRVTELEQPPPQEAYFHSLVDSLSDIVFTLDPDQRCIGVYGQWLARAGLSPEFFLGKTSREILGPDAAPVHEAANLRALQGENVTYNWSAPTTGGTTFYQITISPRRDGAGRIVGIVGLGRDVTALFLAEETLRQSEAKLRTVIDSTYDWEYWITRERHVLYISPSCERISGYLPAEFMANPQLLSNIVHPADRALYEAHWLHHHSVDGPSEVASQVEYRIVCRDGAIRWIEHACAPVCDAQQRFLGRRVSNRDVTEHHQVEIALRESEERYRTLVDLSPDAIYVHQKGRFVFANPMGLNMLGARSAAELMGKPFMDIVHPNYQVLVTQHVQEVSRPGKMAPLLEEKFIRLDGRLIDAEVVATGLIYQGAPAVQVIARDVSARKQAEEALRQSEANLRAIFESSQQSFIFIDRDLACRAFNHTASQRAQALTGKEMRLGESILAYLPPEDVEEFTHSFQRALNGEQVRRERPLAGYADQAWWMEFHYAPVRAADGQIIGVFFNTIDITERRQAEEALRESEEKTRRLFASGLVAICIFDADTLEILDVNEAYEKLYGWTRAELQTMRASDVSAEPQQTQSAVQHATVAGEIHIPLRYHRKKDGTVFPVELFSGPFVWKNRRVLYAMIVDITERQQLYEQLRADTTTKAQLLREVNHRVKNNLIAILGLLLIEQRYAFMSGHPDAVGALENTAHRVKGLLAVHQLLSESQWQPMRLTDLAARLIEIELETLPRRQAITTTIQPSPVEISPRQASNLALVMNELITNTLKYALADRAAARIDLAIGLDEQFIQLNYRDDGPGYPASILAGEYHSTGLHLVKQLVTETLRGALTLYNHQGAVAAIRIRIEETDRT